jgi:hypothetical protein
VTAEVLARFQNNPFSICRAAVASGAMDIQDPLPMELAPLALPGRAVLVDKLVLSDVAVEIGSDAFARIVDAAIRESSLAFVVGPVAERLAAALFSCLPPSHRKELSLTTGLQFSERRPFRWLAVPDDAVQQRQLQRRHGVFVVRTSHAENQNDAPLSGWARFVGECLSQQKLSVLEVQLRNAGDVANLDELNTLGEDYLRKGVIESAEPDGDSISFRSESRKSEPRRDTWRRTQHGAHASKSVNAAENQPWAARTRPSSQITCEAPDTRHFLEELDDLIYGGVVGDVTTLARLDDLWTVVASDLGAERADHARELYVRLAIDLWNESKEGSAGDPKRAVAAIEIIDQLLVAPDLAARA